VRVLLVAVALVTVACDTRVGEEPAVRFTIERLAADMAAVARDEDPTVPCAAIRQALVELAGNRRGHVVEVTTSARARCRAALLAFTEERTATIARPRARRVEGCVDVDRALALLADLAPGDATALELDRRRKPLCP
jgi:hypothetical protein